MHVQYTHWSVLIYCCVTIAAKQKVKSYCWVTFIVSKPLPDSAVLLVVEQPNIWWSKFQVASAHFGNVQLSSQFSFIRLCMCFGVGDLHLMKLGWWDGRGNELTQYIE